jgi:acetyl-CoA carboxylase biotin carboxylase subunit
MSIGKGKEFYMFKKILVANRGEIAVRIIRACREMGIETVAIYSEMDRESLHKELADEAICVGKDRSNNSYLHMENILTAALLTGCDAIHPGFGFLSENAKFARLCESNQIKFIGPRAETIEKMGEKSMARHMMIQAGVPVVPGSEGAISNLEQAIAMAEQIEYPVIIKASAGGGGKGMRIAFTKEEIASQFETAKMEAFNSFGDDQMYMEKFIVNPKHIEIQILADEHGSVFHLGERDCSLQRRNQKMIEEAPSSVLSNEERQALGALAVKGATFVGYHNAGTMEFLMDENHKFYFIEMNTRIQVEHPVTEMVTGIDLIKAQIDIAAGKPLNFVQSDLAINGHAIECRINAEDPSRQFQPSPGTIEEMFMPGGLGVRIDSAVYRGYKIPPTYDSMIGKLIVHAPTREEAILRMKRALGELVITGVKTNIDFQYLLISQEAFADGSYDTGYIGRLLENK